MSSGVPLSLLSVGALALAAGIAQHGSLAFGHEGHWGSAGAGILLVAGTGENRKVLILLRSQEVTEPGLWNLAGGAVDRNEDPLEAGLRELDEETGLRFAASVARDHLLGQTVWNSPNGRFRYTTSVVEAPVSLMRRPLELNWENDESMWVDADWLRENADQLHPGFRAKMDELIAIAFGDSSPAGSAATRARSAPLSKADLLSTSIHSAAAAKHYLTQFHALSLTYPPEDRTEGITHKADTGHQPLFTNREAKLASTRMREVHRYLPDLSETLLEIYKKAGSGNDLAQGSRSTDDSITVVRVTPHRVGFAGHAVVRNLSRGKPHDPHAVHHVEVLLEADDADTLRDPRRAHQVAREAAAMHGVRPGFARTVSGVYPAGGMGAPRWRVRVDVE